MKISNTQMNQILALYAQQCKAAGAKAKTSDTEAAVKSSDKRDEVVLSDRAREIQLAMKAAKAAPEIREELVHEIKEKIKNGTYSVSANDIAQMMINRAMADKLMD